MKKIDAKANQPPSGNAPREIQGAENESPAFELANGLPPVYRVRSLQRGIASRTVGPEIRNFLQNGTTLTEIQ